ncbi:MAG TPA: SIS domain-containing protein [Marinagarivorans sp.]
MSSQRVYEMFQASIEAKMNVGEPLAPLIAQAADALVQTLLHEGKILVCGNGPSSALAQMFSASLIDRYEKERPSLPSIWLGANMASYTAMVTPAHYNEVYAKPIRALGEEGDTLVLITTSGNASNLIQAVTTAHDRGLNVIALTGRDGGDIASVLDSHDIELRADIDSRSRIHEIHLLTLYCLCDLIDRNLFGIE